VGLQPTDLDPWAEDRLSGCLEEGTGVMLPIVDPFTASDEIIR